MRRPTCRYGNCLFPDMAIRQPFNVQHSSLLGLAGCVLVLAATAITAHQDALALLNVPGLIIVVGGTLAATLVSRPLKDVARAAAALRSMLRDADAGIDAELTQLVTIAYWYRAGNIAAAEQAINGVSDPLLRIGAQQVIDREPLDDIVKVLQWRIAGIKAREHADAHVLRTMAALAPVFGMLGTLFGLMQLLNHLGDAGMTSIGSSMSFALTTTLYGLVLANMVFKPLAIKMERRTAHRVLVMHVILEGIVLLHQRRHPLVLKETLTAYLLQHRTHGQAALQEAA